MSSMAFWIILSCPTRPLPGEPCAMIDGETHGQPDHYAQAKGKDLPSFGNLTIPVCESH